MIKATYSQIAKTISRLINYRFSSENVSCSQRQWLHLEKENQNASRGNQLRIMQYNVLAPCYTYPSLFPNCTKKDLDWQRRLDLLVKEIQFVNPTVLCLQETQLDTLFDLNEKLKEIFPYSAIHRVKGKSKQDGCTTIYNLDEYEEVYSVTLDLNQSNNKWEELRWISCENICLFTLLRRRDTPDQYILIGNTHFIYSPQMGIVKLGQAKLITSAINSILNAEKNKHVDVFLCGDFNFIPNSALYSFLSQQSINYQGLPLLEVSNQKHAYKFEKNEQSIQDHFKNTTCKYELYKYNSGQEEELVPQFKSLLGLDVIFDMEKKEFVVQFNKTEMKKENSTITSKVNLKSAYAELYKQYNLKHPQCQKSIVNNLISNIPKKDSMTFEYGLSHLTKDGYLQCDFIWYRFAEPNKKRQLVQILQQHDYSYVNSFKAFPNQCHPSDHFPIAASFQFEN